MTRDELLETLRRLEHTDDCEERHREADAALIDFINDAEVEAAYGLIGKWYS